MNNKFININTKKSAIITLFLVSIHSYSQNHKSFQEFDRYKSWSFGSSYYLFGKEQVKSIYGSYTYVPLNSNGYSFSIRKIFNRTGKFSFITGLTLNYNNLYKFEYQLKQEDISSYGYTEDFDFKVSGTMTRRQNFSIPILLEYKSKINWDVFFNGQIGVETMYMDTGFTEYSSSFYTENTNGKTLIYYNLYNSSNSKLYPNLVLSPGFYFMFKDFMIQTNIVYSKSLKNQYVGSLSFKNLDVSENSLLEVKKSGDYIGLSLYLFFKNRRY